MSSEADEFEKYMLLEAQRQIETMIKDGENMLKRNVESLVYNYYSPTSYDRTYNLENSIVCKFDTTTGQIYFEESQLTHYSAVTNEKVQYVPLWTDMGHEDSTGKSGAYHTYSGRNYLQKTIDELEQKYGVGCVQKIDDTE